MARLNTYPYPVLGLGDDVGEEDSVDIRDIKLSFSPQFLEIEYTVHSPNSDFDQLASEGALELRFKWKCSSTLKVGFGEMERIRSVQNGVRCRTVLDQEDLLGRVNVEIFGVAGRNLEDFRWSEQNPDYGDAKFSLRRGDIMAIFPKFTFDADKQFDPLNPPLNDLYSIQRSTRSIRGIEVDLADSEKIVVFVNEQLFDQLNQITALPHTLIALIVLPSLTQAVVELKAELDGGESQGLTETRWGATLSTLIDNANIADKSAFEIAQHLVNYPISGAVAEILPKDNDDEQ